MKARTNIRKITGCFDHIMIRDAAVEKVFKGRHDRQNKIVKRLSKLALP